MSNRLIFSLDIGSSKITALVGSIGDHPKIYGFSTHYFINNSKINDYLCINHGVICDLNSVVDKVSKCLSEAQYNADCSVGGVIVNMSNMHINSRYAKPIIKITNGIVNEGTIRDLIRVAISQNLEDNTELVDFEVQEYLLDNENYTINPIGLSCDTIKANINLFLGNKSQSLNIKKVISSSGYGVARIVHSGILSGMSVLNFEEKSLGCCLIDIGLGTTDIVVYENGFIRYLKTLPIGGEQITKDIANVLKLSRNLAEDIKIGYGSCIYDGAQYRDSVDIVDHRGVPVVMSRKMLVQIISARLSELFEYIKLDLNKQGVIDIIGSGFVITGGTVLLPRFDELASKVLMHQVRIGFPNYDGDFADLVQSPRYSVLVGALHFANAYMRDDVYGVDKSTLTVSNLFNKIKKFFK